MSSEAGVGLQLPPAFMAFLLFFLRHLQLVPGSRDNNANLMWSMDTSTRSPHLVRPTASLHYCG